MKLDYTIESTQKAGNYTKLYSGLSQTKLLQIKKPIESAPKKYHPLIHAQEAIGWNQILLGQWTTKWVKYMDHHKPQLKKNYHKQT
jgi:hypothetical protein